MSDFDMNNATHVALYDELPLWSAHAGALLLEHVPLTARRALDLGCGAGFPLLELAERLGRDAFVVGVDPWGAALSRAREKALAWGVANAFPVRGDGVRLAFRDEAFELITCNLGVNNFSHPDATLRECRRVLTPGGMLAMTTNVVGHFAEWYEAMAEVLQSRGDVAALGRLREHIAHRGTVEQLHARLDLCGLSPAATHKSVISFRFRDALALLDHHFMRLGFVGGWREVAGSDADSVLSATAARLNAHAREGEGVRLSVPLVLVLTVRR